MQYFNKHKFFLEEEEEVANIYEKVNKYKCSSSLKIGNLEILQ